MIGMEKAPTFAFVDTETSGMVPRHHRVVEVGVCITDVAFTPLSTWHTMVNPQTSVTNSRIHGLDDDVLASAPLFGEIAGSLSGKLHGLRLVAHNARFDASFLEAEYARIGVEFCSSPDFSWIDSLAIAREQLDGSHKLDALCDRFGVVNPRPHSAMGDAVSTALIVQAVAESVGPALLDQMLAVAAYQWEKRALGISAQRAPVCRS